MKFNKETLRKDFTLRTLSVFLAVFLWIFVLNDENPYIEIQIPIIVKDKNKSSLEKNGLKLKDNDYKRFVFIFVKARRSNKDLLKDSDFEAYLDFSKVKTIADSNVVIDSTNIKYLGKLSQNSFTIKDMPQEITLDLVENKTDPYKVQVVTNDNLKSEYKIVKTSVSPEKINIVDNENKTKLASAKVILGDDDIKKGYVKKICKYFDENNNEILSIKQNIEVEVTITLGKEVQVKPTFEGNVDENYVISDTKVSPDKLIITGNYENLDLIESLKTEPIKLNKSNLNLYETKKLILPPKIQLKDGIDLVGINVQIEPISKKDIVLKPNEIDITNKIADESLTYEILDASIQAPLKGLKKDLEGFNNSNVGAQIDVTGLSEGKHQVLLKLSKIGQSEITLTENCFVTVKVSKK